MKKTANLVPVERIQKQIFLLRGQKVMLSQHLAELYGVSVKVLNQAVSRNRRRFPDDFMFQLDRSEFENLKSQFVTSNRGGIRRARPYAFTEQGVAMLSSVLRFACLRHWRYWLRRCLVKNALFFSESAMHAARFLCAVS